MTVAAIEAFRKYFTNSSLTVSLINSSQDSSNFKKFINKHNCLLTSWNAHEIRYGILIGQLPGRCFSHKELFHNFEDWSKELQLNWSNIFKTLLSPQLYVITFHWAHLRSRDCPRFLVFTTTCPMVFVPRSDKSFIPFIKHILHYFITLTSFWMVPFNFEQICSMCFMCHNSSFTRLKQTKIPPFTCHVEIAQVIIIIIFIRVNLLHFTTNTYEDELNFYII